MSGHSKWATIKHKKEMTDNKRGQLFTKLTREITVAAREGGADMDTNFRLRIAVQRARAEQYARREHQARHRARRRRRRWRREL